MHKRSDVPRSQPESPEVEYYKALAQFAEDRAREIRRIAALERARLEERLLEQEPTIKAYAEEQERLRVSYDCLKASSQRLRDDTKRLKVELASTRAQLRAFQKAQRVLGASRAHRLANAYMRLATGDSLFARTLRLVRPAARALNQIRRALLT
jgi:septal ring factor EnvC (AmiA/AmiB activator)